MEKTRKRRKDSYFGIHFDFHARRGTHPVGHNPRPDIFAEMLDAVKPDYLQCDTKGHAGLSSYPTQVGNQAENISCDVLKMLRELTRERGVALYGHHSGIYDQKAAADHPDWAVVSAEGVVSRDMMSVFGPYCEQLLIPQMIELAVDYDLDGVWVDGESWGTKLDYSAHAIRAWQKKTGSDLPPKPGEAGFEAYKEFCRQGFREHIMRYTTAVKAAKSDFQVTSNWMYSAEVPEKPVIPLDFISGDYMATNSYESARFHGRCMMQQGLSWDLMAWGQQAPCSWVTDDRNTKEAPQYCQEAAAVLSLGGGFQFFNPQYDGGCMVQKWAIPVWAEVAKFCRERQDYCFGAKSVPQAAIVFSRRASYAAQGVNELFGCGNPAAQRVNSLVQLCCDCQLPNDVLMSHHVLERDLSEYGLIMVPDFDEMEPEVMERLKEYARQGGQLLLAGPDAARAFGFDLDKTQTDRLTYIAQDGRMAAYQGRRADMTGENVTALLYDANYFEADSHAACVNVKTGAGSMEALAFDLADMYANNRTSVIRSFFKALSDRLFPDRLARLSGSMYVDMAVNRLRGRLMIHLVNTAGPHRDARERGFSEIPPIGPVEVQVRLEKEPESVRIQPGNRPAECSWQEGLLTVRVERLALYDIVEITEEK